MSMTACEPSGDESWWVGARFIELASHLLDSDFLRDETATFWNPCKHSSYTKPHGAKRTKQRTLHDRKSLHGTLRRAESLQRPYEKSNISVPVPPVSTQSKL